MRPLALLLFLAGPAAAEVVVEPDLTPTDAGTIAGEASVAVGETLAIRLPGQAGTGYSWEPRPVDPALLSPREAGCAAAPADGLVGAAAPACFAWEAVAPGEAVIVLVYRRHWETSPDGVLRYDLAVTVRPAE